MKTITMMQLRREPGEYSHAVRRYRESFLVTYQGKPAFKMVPVEEITVINSDGTVVGPKPLTFKQKLGGEYAQ